MCFLHYAMLRVFSGHTTMSGVPENPKIDTKSWICYNSVENNINLLFGFGKMAAILDFTHNSMFRDAYWPHHYVGVPENSKIDTKIMNFPLFCRKLYQLMFDLHQMAVVLFVCAWWTSIVNLVLISQFERFAWPNPNHQLVPWKSLTCSSYYVGNFLKQTFFSEDSENDALTKV